MHFLLMVLRLVLSVLFPSPGDRLSLAARSDGRVEHVPHRLWDWLLASFKSGGSEPGWRAPKVRARRSRGSTATPSARVARSSGNQP
jgi:hypothetical protein